LTWVLVWMTTRSSALSSFAGRATPSMLTHRPVQSDELARSDDCVSLRTENDDGPCNASDDGLRTACQRAHSIRHHDELFDGALGL
jgi:hypothetical protein